MKRIILTILAYLIIITGANAAKAINEPFVVNQPDGTQLTVVLRGDEYFHWYATTDGILLYPTGQQFVVAEVNTDGTLSPTLLTAHDRQLRTAAETTVARCQSRDLFYKQADEQLRQNARRREPIGSGTYFPHTGKPKAVVILTEFTDVKFTVKDPKKTFDQLFNSMETQQDYGNGEQRNHGSLRRYFSDMSFGAFEPEFEIVGPVTVPNEMKYYGGSKATSANDERPQDLVNHAIAQIDGQVDFSLPEYDANGDGKIDLVYIVYAGYGQNSGGPAESVWARAGSISGSVDGKSLSRYCMTCELNRNEAYWTSRSMAPQVNGVGVSCHEFSHTMGLPDLYPTTTTARVDNQEMEYWDLMDGGEYVNNGYRPTAYTAWEREAMGWMSIETLNTTRIGIQIEPVLNGGKAYRIENPENSRDYLILENIQNNSWNGSIPGHGLLVYHVNYPSATVNMSDNPNNTPNRPSVAVVPADGILASSYLIGEETSWGTGTKTDSDGNIISDHIATSLDYHNSHYGDPFPGSANVTSLTTDLSLPNFRWYSETTEIGCALYRIAADTETGVVTFDYSHNGMSATPGIMAPADNDTHTYTLDGRRITGSLPRGIYVVGDRKVAVP